MELSGQLTVSEVIKTGPSTIVTPATSSGLSFPSTKLVVTMFGRLIEVSQFLVTTTAKLVSEPTAKSPVVILTVRPTSLQ